MNNLEKCLLLAVLKDTIDQLKIVNQGIYSSAVLVRKKPVEERFKDRLHETAHRKLDPFQLPMETLDRVKLEKEMNHTNTIFVKTFEEIKKSGTFEFMLNAINEQRQQEEDEAKLKKDYEESCKELKNIRRHYARKVTQAEIRLHVTDENIHKLKNELDCIQMVNDIEMSLVQRWQQTRFDQAEMLRKRSEKEITSETELLKTKIEKEKRNIIDIENYINILVEDYKRQILYWEDRYQVEMAELSAETKKISKQIVQVKKKYEKHTDTFKQRQEFIDEYCERKAEEQRQLEFQQRRINSAVFLQAWWRGVMVRRCLGPFKKKKKGKKGKKK